MPAKSGSPVATIVVKGSALLLISGTQESEDQEYMHKPFERNLRPARLPPQM
jgi:hypothetical protein